MKNKILKYCAEALFFPMIVWALALPFVACVSCLKDGSSAVQSVGANGTYSPSTDTWGAGITIVFKTEPPSNLTTEKLEAAGAVRVKPKPETWVLPRYDRANDKQNAAIEASLREGATLTKSP